MEFKDWLTKKFIEDALRRNKRPVVSDLAKRLGMSQPTVSRWMNGNTIPDENNIRKLAKLFGLEVYDVLGLQRPTKLVEAHYFSSKEPMSVEEMHRIFKRANSLVSHVEDDEERKQLLFAYLETHGLEHLSTHVEDDEDGQEEMNQYKGELETLIEEMSEEERGEIIKLLRERRNEKGRSNEESPDKRGKTATANSAS